MRCIRDFDPGDMVPTEIVFNEGDRVVAESSYTGLNYLERALLAAQDGYCQEHGLIFPIS